MYSAAGGEAISSQPCVANRCSLRRRSPASVGNAGSAGRRAGAGKPRSNTYRILVAHRVGWVEQRTRPPGRSKATAETKGATVAESMAEFMERVEARSPGEPEFHQAVQEVVESVWPVLDRHSEFRNTKVLDRMVEPERVIMFRVPWVDDAGEVHVNRGFRVEMNSAIGPYKGGLRFHPTRQPRRAEVPGLRAGLQERADDPAAGRRQGRLRLRSQGPQRRRGDAILPVVHDRAVPPHRRPHRRPGR